MPYKREGNKVMHYKNGKWSVKQTCSSAAAAEAAIRLLQGVEHGWKPTGKKTKHHSAGDGTFLDERRKKFGV
uniref:Uncharacterized protein n=1 Tax=viral metagenome TaxID=1070528 RepID=A0A6M3IF68_9ZZZZ